MLSFLEYFEEGSKQRELFYHVTDGKNLKAILSQGLIPNRLSNFEDEYDAGTHSKKSYFGNYMGRNLKQLMMTADDWGVVDLNDIGVIVIESRGFTQLFMDEDNIINALPYIKEDVVASKLDEFVESGFSMFPEMRSFIVDFLKAIKAKFHMNTHQREALKNILIANSYGLFFRGIDRNPSVDPEKVRQFLEHYNKPNTESWFRDTFDKITKLKLKFKNKVTDFDLDSVRITKTIGVTGNPRIVGIYRFTKNPLTAEILYSRLDKAEESDIIQTGKDVVEFYNYD